MRAIRQILIVAIVCVVAVALLSRTRLFRKPEPSPANPPPAAASPVVRNEPTPPPASLVEEKSAATNPVPPATESSPKSKTNSARTQIASQPVRRSKPPLMDPDAREALALVGVDPDAEDYWFDAINDPSLPAKERQDLIEDLNEVGLSDPNHPGRGDLPVIVSRLKLLEQMDAMDQVNADAMKEAYKDLVNLARLASGTGGEPVN